MLRRMVLGLSLLAMATCGLYADGTLGRAEDKPHIYGKEIRCDLPEGVAIASPSQADSTYVAPAPDLRKALAEGTFGPEYDDEIFQIEKLEAEKRGEGVPGPAPRPPGTAAPVGPEDPEDTDYRITTLGIDKVMGVWVMPNSGSKNTVCVFTQGGSFCIAQYLKMGTKNTTVGGVRTTAVDVGLCVNKNGEASLHTVTPAGEYKVVDVPPEIYRRALTQALATVVYDVQVDNRSR